MSGPIVLSGEDLTLEDVWDVAVHGRAATIADASKQRMRAARELVESMQGEHTYGVNTGFGRFVSAHIPEELTDELQLRLLRSHACGVGEPYPDEVVRGAMVLRANALAKGFSGARVATVELLVECLNRGVLPVVPARGSVGASGDLAPLAHLALPLVGEGEAIVDGERLDGASALGRVGLEPIRLASKEGLSLVNGTQFMTSMAALCLVRARRLAKTADIACALSLESLQGSRTSFAEAVHRTRPLKGQRESAANVWRLLEGSAIIESHRWCDKVQDAYALRCAPQVHGATRDLLDYAEATVTVELNAATDNPLVLLEEGEIVSAGNFHGQPVAFALDVLAIATAELASISERRTERMVNPSLSDGLPPFLVEEGGLNSGFMIPQYVAASLVSENKVLAHPASVDSIPTSAGQEDHVSMGNAAGLKALQVLDNVERTLAIELLAGTQAVEFLAPLRPADAVSAAHDFVRSLSDRLVEDRSLGADIERVADADSLGRARGSGRGHRRGAGMSVTTPNELVEALCGDLSAISAPRGSALNARSWQTEAPLRMLLNNLDPAVAEHPERLVVYGGTGKAARSHDALKAIVRVLLRLGDDETLLVQSGKPVGVFRTGEWAPRVLIANALLVPRWATWDEFRRLEAEGLTMFGQMTAGSWIYIGTQGILQGTYQTFAAAGERHFGTADLTGRTILTAGLGGMGGAQPLAATMCGAAILCVEVDPSRLQRRLETRYLDESADVARRRGRPRSCGGGGGEGALGRPARQRGGGRARAGAPRRALRSRHRPDGSSRPADRLRAPRPRRRGRGAPPRNRSRRVPAPGSRVHRGSCRRPAASSSGQAAMFSTMATTCEGRHMKQA